MPFARGLEDAGRSTVDAPDDSLPACYDGAAELERGLDILLTGLATTLPPPGDTEQDTPPALHE